ncbi:MAG: hypothetical protein BWK76_02900 [Desulfobulbaceae bacterium A2]|nr:MAG: hypothetical protein BWK76_02900 [Desulfobulbaceae bacterium A2]
MNLRPRVLLTITLIISVLVLLFCLLLVRQQVANGRQVIAATQEAARAILAQRQDMLQSQYRGRLKSLVEARPEAINAFAAGDRQELLLQAQRLATVFERENPWFAALFFILPDNQVFLRAQNPEYHGDDAALVSPLIAAANHSRQPTADFELVRGGLHYRLVHPVEQHGRYLGLAGFGIDSRYLIEDLGSRLDCDVALALPAAAGPTMSWLQAPLIKHGDYLLLSQHGNFFAQAPTALDPRRDEQRLRVGDRHVVVLAHPLTNDQGEELGRILIARDISAMVRETLLRLLQTLGQRLVLLALALLLLYVVLGRLLQHNQTLTTSLRRSNETLEERVLERTRALEQETIQRRQAEQRAERARRMEAIGLMAGGVAHDLNNILSGLSSYPEFLLMQVGPDSPLRGPLLSIEESGRRAAAVVADLLTVSRGVACVKKPHSINGIVRSYLDSPEAKRLVTEHPAVALVSDLQAKGVCLCSAMHLQKVLMNLVTNAVEALQDKGRVRIATRDEGPGQHTHQVHNVRPGPWVVLTVEDNGPGIDETNLPHIFEPFYSRKKLGRSGTGLGLAVVWNAIQDHGGDITVASSPAGTVFTVHLPACDENEAATLDGEVSPDELRGSGRILVVDDEMMQREVAAKMLKLLGYEVYTVAGGEDAVRFLHQQPVDLVLLDMLMDGMNGVETFRAIRAINPVQKAIIASGYSGSTEFDQARELGARCLLMKPYSMVQLGQAVRMALTG